jgi:hypothetical protein
MSNINPGDTNTEIPHFQSPIPKHMQHALESFQLTTTSVTLRPQHTHLDTRGSIDPSATNTPILASQRGGSIHPLPHSATSAWLRRGDVRQLIIPQHHPVGTRDVCMQY